jgi:hypothetical protein
MLKTLPPCDGVLDGVGESVSEVKLSGDVWWRNHHHKHVVFQRLVFQCIPA